MTGTLAPSMSRPATGTIDTHAWKDGRTVSFYLRVRYQGERHRVPLGTNHQGWSIGRAQVELDRVLGQIERGTWEPPARDTTAARLDVEETVHVTASRWWGRRESDLDENTRADYLWRLGHILRHLAKRETRTLDTRAVDEFRGKLQKHRNDRTGKALSPRSVNMILDVLAQILSDAVEAGLLDANPAAGKRRRMKVPKSSRSFLEPDMVVDLLDAAGGWEAGVPVHQRYGRRAFLATLCLAGPRISELTDSDRGRLDLHAGSLVLGKKTAAGRDRHLDLTAFLLDELRSHLAGVPAVLRDERGPRLPVFPTRTGGRLNPSNVRNRLLTETVRRANEKRAGEGRMLLPDRVTPHTLRRTFASLCFFAGRDLRYVMGQLGHDDPRMTLGVYAQAMKRRDVDEQLVWQLMRFPDEEETRRGRDGRGRGRAGGGVDVGQVDLADRANKG